MKFINIGKIVNTHGIKGELRIRSDFPYKDRVFVKGNNLMIDDKEYNLLEALEETGINIKIIGPSFDGINIEPISVARYINKVGDMIDISYLSIPITKKIKSQEEKEAVSDSHLRA